MNIRWFLVIAAFSTWAWPVSAAPVAIHETDEKVPSKPVADWVKELSDELFRVREKATRKLWEIGDKALPELQEAAQGKDPEAAYRARELIRKIELHLTPETDPEVMKLVERYAKSSTDEKQDLLAQMQRKRAWRQILKLFASESNAELRRRVESSVVDVAVIAARESLLQGDPDGAREYLEMAPANPAGLLALADFHRSQGTLEAELKRAKTLKGRNGDEWQLALYRASGNIDAARDAATAAGESRISAAMSVLLGDPLPWLRGSLLKTDGELMHKPYSELAIKRWQGKKLLATDLEPLIKGLASRSSTERQISINSLFLLGETGMAEDAYVKISPAAAFIYLESLERIPEALKALGLDPEKPDYTSWVEVRINRINKEELDVDDMEMAASAELVQMACFMDRRGLDKEFRSAFMKPLADLAEKNEKVFTNFLSQLFTNGVAVTGAPSLAKLPAYEWAGEDADRWDDIFIAAFGEDDDSNSVWHWMTDLDPKASRIDRFDGMLALKGMGNDSLRLRDHWLDLGWKAIEETPENQRKPLFEKMSFAIGMNPDVANSLKLWDMVPKDDHDNVFRNTRISELTIAGRWDEATAFFLDQLARVEKFKLNPSPSTHASAAACLRKAGRLKEAAVQDEWVEKLALGNSAYEIAVGYEFGDDFVRAAQWFERAVQQEEPSANGLYAYALAQHGDFLLGEGHWKEAAAVFEVQAQMATSPSSLFRESVAKLTLRLHSDLARALANLKTDRPGSLALLDRCYHMLSSDGTLADYFFPSLRKVGLIAEHDAWFKISWTRMTAVIEEYPGSSNTLNTTGWLAAKAMRNLDQAEEFLNRALAMKSDTPAYLDTMAEIQFGKGDRDKAIEWSGIAINFTTGSDEGSGESSLMNSFLLRQQNQHFRNDPLPK